MIDTYTKLLEVAAESDDKAVSDAAVKKLVAHLVSVGRIKMLPSIAHELRKIQARRLALQPKVEVAHASDTEHALREARALGISVKHASVNPSLISGWRAHGNGKLVDTTGKRSLIEIYRNVTT